MAVDIFFKLGAKIKGESIDGGTDGQGNPLKDQMHIVSWSWNLSQSGSTHRGTGGGAGRANVGDINFTKQVDLSSNEVIKALVSGDHIDHALLTVRKAGGKNPLPYYVILFKDLIVSSYSVGGSTNDDVQMESFSLNFAQFEITYKVQDEKGGQKAESKAGWNIPQNVPFTG